MWCIYASLSLNELRPRKIMNWQARAIFSSNYYFKYSIYKGNITFFGYFLESPDLRRLFYVFWNHDAANILIDYPVFTEFRIYLTVSVGCCLFDLDVIKPWINISHMDQTKFFQLRTALLWESAYGCMTTRRLIIQWSQKTFIIDIIISRKLLWDQKPQTIRILHEWNTKTTLFQSKRVLDPELLTYSREDRLPNRLTQITRIDQTLPIWIQSGPFY